LLSAYSWYRRGNSLSLYGLVERHPTADICVAFETNNNFEHIHINAVCNYLGKEKSTALPALHSLGKGKKKAWKSFPDVT